MTEAVAPAEVDTEQVPRRRRGWALLFLVVPSLLWMTSYVLGGSRVPYYDYWLMADVVWTPDGGLDLSSLLTLQNEHPVVIPDLLYWVNAHLTGGSNTVLGLVIVLVTLGQIAVLTRFVDERRRGDAVVFGLVLVAGILLYSRQGVHLFVAAYSAPLANLFTLLAILALVRGRRVAAVSAGLAASLCNAAGLAAWPALIVVGMVRDRRWRPDPLVTGYGALLGVAYLVLREGSGSEGQDLIGTVKASATVAGAILSSSTGVARAVGFLGGAAAIWLVVTALRSGRGPDVAPWVGVLVYAGGTSLLIGAGRAANVATTGVEGRYASASALFVIGLLGLALTVFDFRALLLAPLAVVAVVGLLQGGAEADLWERREPSQAELATALRLDLADGFTYLPWLGYPRVAPTLDGLDHYPFDGRWDGDCGLLGTTVEPAPPSPAGGVLESQALLDNRRGLRLFGQVPAELVDRVDCLVVVDADSQVVGAGVLGVAAYGAPASDQTFAAVAPVGSAGHTVILVLDDGTRVQLAGELPAPA